MKLNFEPLGSHVNESATLPRNLYTDPEVFEIEKDLIFRRGWLAVCRSAELADVGDYTTYDLFGDPILITRADDGALHALSNVCLHRSCPIATGNGTAQAGLLTCPYHRWTYHLDGRLKGTPLMDEAEGFDKTSLRLPRLAVEEWLGWVFINADPNAADLTPQLATLTTLLEPHDVTAMVRYHTLEFDSPWNWKVMVENFMESYHHMGAHPETLNAAFPAAGTHWVDLDGAYTLLENPAKEGLDEVAPFWVACVFPAMLIAVIRGDSPNVVWYEMDIDAHDHFTLKIHLMAAPDKAADPEYRAGQIAAVTAIHLEDIPMCEGVWKGLHSSFHRDGRLSHLEAANWKFYDYLRQRLTA